MRLMANGRLNIILTPVTKDWVGLRSRYGVEVVRELACGLVQRVYRLDA